MQLMTFVYFPSALIVAVYLFVVVAAAALDAVEVMSSMETHFQVLIHLPHLQVNDQ